MSNYEISGWVPIPSTGGKYEICQAGTVRNAKTKRRLKRKNNSYGFALDDKFVWRSVSNLRAEVFGIAPKRVHKHQVIIAKGYRRFHFESFTDAAKFLMQSNFYSFEYFKRAFRLRLPEICGWRVNYLEDHMPKAFPDNARGRKES